MEFDCLDHLARGEYNVKSKRQEEIALFTTNCAHHVFASVW